MAKVIFEFDDDTDRHDIRVVVDRSKLLCVAYDLDNLYRKIYNYKLSDGTQISVKNNKVLTEEDYMNTDEHPIQNTKSYLDQQYIEQELDNMLQNIRHLIDE